MTPFKSNKSRKVESSMMRKIIIFFFYMYPVKIQILYALLAVKGLLILKQFNSYMVITYIVKEQNF